jgi:hypothetical protein
VANVVASRVGFVSLLSGAATSAADVTRHVRWTGYDTNTISPANADGSGANQSFISGVTTSRRVAGDGQHIEG